MNKVYIVEAMSAEDYENNSWVEKVFNNKPSAFAYIQEQEKQQEGLQIYEQYIYMLKEFDVNE